MVNPLTSRTFAVAGSLPPSTLRSRTRHPATTAHRGAMSFDQIGTIITTETAGRGSFFWRRDSMKQPLGLPDRRLSGMSAAKILTERRRLVRSDLSGPQELLSCLPSLPHCSIWIVFGARPTYITNSDLDALRWGFADAPPWFHPRGRKQGRAVHAPRSSIQRKLNTTMSRAVAQCSEFCKAITLTLGGGHCNVVLDEVNMAPMPGSQRSIIPSRTGPDTVLG